MSALVLLDFSSGFRVIDPSILTRRLYFTFGIEHEALSWMKSYLSDRIQHISIAGCKSTDFQLHVGVPLFQVQRYVIPILTHLERSSNEMVENITVMQMILMYGQHA